VPVGASEVFCLDWAALVAELFPKNRNRSRAKLVSVIFDIGELL
jgi:hypothetical protein